MGAVVQAEIEYLRNRVRELEDIVAATSINDRRLASIIESSDDAIISKDLQGVIQSWNPGAERIFGYTAEEIIGKPITVLIPPERIDDMKAILGRIARGERVNHYETQRRTKDGRIIDVSLTVSPIKDSSGAIAGASKIARDITERQQNLVKEQKARRTAELLSRIGPMLVAELDTGELTETITGIATQLVGAEFGAFFHNVQNEQGESYMLYTLSGAPREAFARFPMPRNTHVFGPTFRGEGVVRSDDITKDPRYGKNPPYHGMPPGHLPVCSYLAVPVVSRSGNILGGLFFGHSKQGVFTDEAEEIVTGIAGQAAIALDNATLFAESQRSQHALRIANEELNRVNEDLNQFAHSASHDLQEPLRMVSIYTQLLKRKLAGKLDREAEQFIAFIVKGASRMEALVRDVLAYTQAAKSSEELPPVTDAEEALEFAVSNLMASMADAGATVTHSALPRVRIAKVHLSQVFQNLIGNAVKYRSERTPRIHVSAERCQDQWRIAVEDNGIGIDERYRKKIFELFSRLHTADEYSGTGIGLAICQRIIERAGGRIWVESQPGQGSTFFFTLPAGD